jgi:hypothetical protein
MGLNDFFGRDISKLLPVYSEMEKLKSLSEILRDDYLNSRQNLLRLISSPYSELTNTISTDISEISKIASMLTKTRDEAISHWLDSNSMISKEINKYHDLFESVSSLSQIKALSLTIESEMNQTLKTYKDTFDSPYSKLSIDSFSHSISASVESMLKAQLQLSKEQKPFLDIVSDIHSDFVLPAHRITESLSKITSLAKLEIAPPFFFEYAVKNTHSYQDFVLRQIFRMKSDSPKIAERRAIVTDYAGDLFDLIDGSSDMGLSQCKNIEQTKIELPGSKGVPNLFPALNRSLTHVYREDREVDALQEAENSIPAQITQYGHLIITLIVNMNYYALQQEPYLSEIFTPTNRMIETVQLIPTLLTKNKNDFSAIVILLHSSLYECSDKRQRLKTIVGGDEKLKPLLQLRNLRNYFAHDTEIWEKKERIKNSKEVADTFKSLIQIPIPLTPNDWMNAQLALYKNISEMLEKVYKVLIS